MAYVDGFVVAVPAANKERYRSHAEEAAPLFEEFGVTRMVETWGDDVPEGKLTDFRRAVKAEDDEVVVFSWFEYPSREARTKAVERMMNDPRMKGMGETMPFDGKRMIYGGFTTILDEDDGKDMGYVDGSLLAVPTKNKDAYEAMARKTAAIFKSHGATRVVDCWADDVPDGKITDFKGAVKAEPDEAVVFSWVQWPSKAARDEGWKKVMADPGMQPGALSMPFDGRRMIYGGFQPLVDR
ncbi:DUF1428 domain-containing protein [Pararhizobium haloflavum]|uniref:DUF1428 domain-containing protein n=1 Tax=Pararhizobium haloflavum TaxID=2037914 RepID=UPI000C186EE0|nr:DUF1428 domain-containing protein [Pararhizobium haloflavum]